jgi:hypothetical protein
MMVARHEMPGNAASGNPSRRVWYDRLATVFDRLSRLTNPGALDHTVPSGTRVWFRTLSIRYLLKPHRQARKSRAIHPCEKHEYS